MSSVLKNLRVFNKLLLIILISVTGMFLLGILSMGNIHDSLLDDRKLKTRHVVETAYQVINYYGQQEVNGLLTRGEAQQQAMRVVRQLSYDQDNYFWINDMYPKMIMHPVKPELEGQDLTAIKDRSGQKIFISFVDMVKLKGEGFVDYLWPKPGAKEAVAKISFVKGYKAWDWIIGSGMYIDDVDAIYWQQAKRLILMVGLVLLVQIGFSLVISQSIVGPVNRLRTFMATVKENHDLTKRVEVSDKSELGEMAISFNELISYFQSSIKGVKVAADQTTESANSLAVVAEQTNVNVGKTVDQTEQLTAAMTRMSLAVSEVASSTRQALGAADAADNETKAGNQVVLAAINSIQKLAGEVEKGVEVITRVEGEAQNITTVVDVIKGIAEQTNLLALNAAIEAARAGEQGRGFAVVADEVRSLAQKTQDSTQEILKIVETLQRVTATAVSVMNNGKNQAVASVEQAAELSQSLGNISQAVANISGMNMNISVAVDEQSSVAGEINESVKTILAISYQTATGANLAAESSDKLRNLAKDLDGKVAIYRV